MKTKKYPIICPSCGGSGINQQITGVFSTIPACPACQGSGIVIATETIDDRETENITLENNPG